jgi:predicted transglutaminase-like cysteine proteinase
MIRRYARDRRVSAVRCRTGGGSWCTVKRWHAFLRTLRDRSPREQMRAVNRYMNRVHYITDQRNYGVIDYWATPRQFFARGGDCEDFAIAKFMSLRALGWGRDRLRIAVVIDRRKRQAHAVLVAYYGGRAYILDNQSRAVLTDNRVRYYHPVYSINERYWWFHMSAQPASR